MNEYAKWYWDKRLDILKSNFERNRFNVYISNNKDDAVEKIFSLISLSDSIGLGGSLTLSELNIPDLLKNKNYNVINFPDKKLPYETVLEQRRQSLLSDVFLTSTNAITSDGYLVNTDYMSNRIAAMMFGPKKVIITAGINKIVKDTEAALWKIRNYTAPQNCKRLNRDTPCVKTSVYADCHTDSRICCNTSVMGYQGNPKRMHLIIIKENLGI